MFQTDDIPYHFSGVCKTGRPDPLYDLASSDAKPNKYCDFHRNSWGSCSRDLTIFSSQINNSAFPGVIPQDSKRRIITQPSLDGQCDAWTSCFDILDSWNETARCLYPKCKKRSDKWYIEIKTQDQWTFTCKKKDAFRQVKGSSDSFFGQDGIYDLRCPDPDEFCASFDPKLSDDKMRHPSTYCPLKCAGNGICIKGFCQCSWGWKDSACIIKVTTQTSKGSFKSSLLQFFTRYQYGPAYLYVTKLHGH